MKLTIQYNFPEPPIDPNIVPAAVGLTMCGMGLEVCYEMEMKIRDCLAEYGFSGGIGGFDMTDRIRTIELEADDSRFIPSDVV